MLVGLPLGVALVAHRQGRAVPLADVNKVLGVIVNIGRSLPFIILMIAVIPLTRLIVGTTIGTVGLGGPADARRHPFFARLVETSLREVGRDKVQAAQAMGGQPWTIVSKVLLPEAMPGLVAGLTMTVVALISYSAMAGTIGGGGLGDLAIRYGYQRFETTLMVITVIVLIAIVQLVQTMGDLAARPSRPPLHPSSLESRAVNGASVRLPGTFSHPLGHTVRKDFRAIASVATALILGAHRLRIDRPATGADAKAASSAQAVLEVGASPIPHAEILNFVKDNLAAKAGLKLEVNDFADYVQPNMQLDEGQLDANYFQNQPYLDDFNETKGTNLPFVTVHLEPLGLYSKKITDAASLGQGATVALPNDAVNGPGAQIARRQRPDHPEGRRRHRGHPADITGNPKDPEVQGAGGRAAAPFPGGRGRRGHQR